MIGRFGLVLLLSFVGVAHLVNAEDTSPLAQTANGKVWRSATLDRKIGYVQGYNDAVFAANMFGQCEGKENLKTPTNASASDTVRAIDQFYSDEANVRIPMRWGIWWVMQKLSGMDIVKLDSGLSTLRSLFN